MHIGYTLLEFFQLHCWCYARMPALNNFFGLCIDELEELVTKFVQEECIQDIVIGNVGIMHLDVVIAMVAIKQVCKTNIDKKQCGRNCWDIAPKLEDFPLKVSLLFFSSSSASSSVQYTCCHRVLFSDSQ